MGTSYEQQIFALKIFWLRNWQIFILRFKTRDVVLTKKVRERTKKIANLKQLQTHFKAQREKGVGTPFPRVPALLHPCLEMCFVVNKLQRCT